MRPGLVQLEIGVVNESEDDQRDPQSYGF